MNYKVFYKIIIMLILIYLLYFYIISRKLEFTQESIITQLPLVPDCESLFRNNVDKNKIAEAEKWQYPKNETLTDLQLANNIKRNCQLFLKEKQYFLTTYDGEERKFSIAFTIVTFKSVMQVERLLRTVYRPWNVYCIHVDKKSDSNFFLAIEELTMCLNNIYGNIINTVNREDVEWGKISVLNADLNCMKELYERYKSWKYVINLTGQEFPLKTNNELVKILKAYNGANNLEGTYKRRNEERVPTVKMPFPVIWYKGSVHITANRDFIKFIFESPKAKIILEALRKQDIPDEQFFATLNFNSQFRIPGSFIGNLDEDSVKNQPLYYFLTRYKNWGEYSCVSGKIVRGICIWGVGDLHKLVKVKHLFANKFYEDFQPATLRCLEKWYYEKMKNETLNRKTNIDINFYKTLIFVKNQFQPLDYMHM